MIMNKTMRKGEGIQFLPNRFHCNLSKDDKVFREGKNYGRTLKLSLILSLLFCIVFFQTWKRMRHQVKITQMSKFALSVEEIPRTEQQARAPAPSRPTVPIASEDEDLPPDETIDDTSLDLYLDGPLPPPPTPPENEAIVFVPYDEPPVPFGGYAAIKSNAIYPEMARRSGISGTVILQVRVDENEKVNKVKVFKSVFESLDQAAIDAVYKVKWKPAMQRDKPVVVWVTIRLDFKLTAIP